MTSRDFRYRSGRVELIHVNACALSCPHVMGSSRIDFNTRHGQPFNVLSKRVPLT